MIRTVVKPSDQNISIKLPKSFIGKDVEVIAFTIEETRKITAITDPVVTHFASEKVLARDWLSIDEDIAWQDL